MSILWPNTWKRATKTIIHTTHNRSNKQLIWLRIALYNIHIINSRSYFHICMSAWYSIPLFPIFQCLFLYAERIHLRAIWQSVYLHTCVAIRTAIREHVYVWITDEPIHHSHYSLKHIVASVAWPFLQPTILDLTKKKPFGLEHGVCVFILGFVWLRTHK